MIFTETGAGRHADTLLKTLFVNVQLYKIFISPRDNLYSFQFTKKYTIIINSLVSHKLCKF